MMMLIPKVSLTPDAFTYGEWTQFVALMGDNAQCCRRAYLPTVLSMIGCALFVVMLVAMVVFGPLSAAGLSLLWLAGACQGMIAIEVATHSLWMVPLGPVMPRGPDGQFYRVFPGEDAANDK